MRKQIEHLTNTEYERLALQGRVNLCDGHARQALSARQRHIVDGALALLDNALIIEQGAVEARFLASFFECARQPHARTLSTFLAYSSSCSIKLAAQYCRLMGLTVHLIEPCFDSILHLLKTEGVAVRPISEAELAHGGVGDRLDPSSAVWIVQPNNPTGFCLDEPSFEALAASVGGCGATLVVDWCFRFYAKDLTLWDQYGTLRESGVEFICLEDTGKTWGLADTKVGISVCSQRPAALMHRLHDELLLNVSPFHLLLLSAFIEDTKAHGVDDTVRTAIEANREAVHDLVAEGLLSHPFHTCGNVPLELVGTCGGRRATQLWRTLHDRGVDILPADNYWWGSRGVGRSMFRLPLSRPETLFKAGVEELREALRSLTAK